MRAHGWAVHHLDRSCGRKVGRSALAPMSNSWMAKAAWSLRRAITWMRAEATPALRRAVAMVRHSRCKDNHKSDRQARRTGRRTDVDHGRVLAVSVRAADEGARTAALRDCPSPELRTITSIDVTASFACAFPSPRDDGSRAMVWKLRQVAAKRGSASREAGSRTAATTRKWVGPSLWGKRAASVSTRGC